jgi:hypothetical protein
MKRSRILWALVAVAAALLVGAGPASAAAFKATLKAPNHSPKGGGKNWDITVTARSNSGRALRATAYYEFLYAGQKVSTQYPNPGHAKGGTRPYRFKGSYKDTILWPARAAGYELTFRVIVAVPGMGHQNLDWKVRVHR